MLKLVTHNGDYPVNERKYKNKPTCVKAWWGQNIAFLADNLFSLPIGLENTWYRNNLQYTTINKQIGFKNLKERKKFKNLLYINHTQKWGGSRRVDAYTYFKNTDWATIKNGCAYHIYVEDIINHNFILCPDGNGIDTHRLWETLYLGSIPIVFEGINTKFYKDLPICYINSYEEITPNFLQQEYERILNTEWNFKKLDLTYWINNIKNYRL